MRTSPAAAIPAILAVLGFAAGCKSAPKPAEPPAQPNLALFGALPDPPEAAALNNPMVDLGRMLYYDARLSRSQEISCNSCHDLKEYGVDGQPTSDGFKGQTGTRNSPTVYNASRHLAQFWDGRAPDVEAQAKGPILNPVEMAMPSEHVVVAVLESMPEYVAAFKQAFPGEPSPVTYDNMAKAIGAFERNLVTPARWDAFQRGDQSVLTAEEQSGLRLFTEAGCAACHNGMLLGGNSFQRLGAVKPYPREDDPGREAVTAREADRGVFKVPSLRNVEKTAPYLHDGRVSSLEEAVHEMGEYQLGRNLTNEEVGKIVTFLRTLTGRLPLDYIKEPALPTSTAKTPKPSIE